MKKKLLLLFSVLLLFTMGTSCFLFFNNSWIIDKFNNYIEENSGALLIADIKPELLFFPNRGLELHKSAWKSKDETIHLEFDKATVFISSRYIFLGKIKIKNITIDNLNIEINPKKQFVLSPEKMNADEINKTSRYILDYLVKLFNIVPNEINIHNANIKIVQPDQSVFYINDLTIDANNVQPEVDTSIKISTNLSIPAFKSLTTIKADLIARLSQDKFSLNIPNFYFRQNYNGKNIERALSGKIEADLSSHKIAFHDLTLQGDSSQFSISGTSDSLEKLFKTPLISNSNFKVYIDGSPEKLLELFHIPGLDKDFITKQHIILDTKLDLANGTCQLNNLNSKIGEVSATGNLIFKPSNLSLEGSISFNTIKASKALEFVTYEKQTTFFLDKIAQNLSINLHINKLRFHKFDLENYQVKITGTKGMYRYNPIRFSFAGSDIIGTATTQILTYSPLSLKSEVTISVPKLDLSKLPVTLTGEERYTGTVSFNATLGFHNQKRLKSIQGSGNITSSDFTASFDLADSKIFNYTPIKHFNAFSKASSSFSIHDGIITCSKIAIRSPSFNFAGTGSLNLSELLLQLKGTLNLPDSSAYTIEITDDLSKRIKAKQEAKEKEKSAATKNTTFVKN